MFRCGPVAQALVVRAANHQPVWFELRPLGRTQAEACATQDLHPSQRDSAQQAEIGQSIRHASLGYPGSNGFPKRTITIM